MITSIMAFFNTWTLLINFICHLSIFVGILYTAVHNSELTRWVVTPLWYLALISGFVVITILIQWVVGPEHPLSYWTLGQLGEAFSHVILALISLVLLVKTVQQPQPK